MWFQRHQFFGNSAFDKVSLSGTTIMTSFNDPCKFVLSVTCDIPSGGALPLFTAGRHFSGCRIKVTQLAGESSGAAKAAASRPGHIVDGVHGGKH